MNVLIVEDDPMVALINKRYLEQITDIKTFGPVMYENDIIKSLKEKLKAYEENTVVSDGKKKVR